MHSHDRQAAPSPPNGISFPFADPMSLKDAKAMLHFSCDICGKDLAANSSNRYVVKVEGYAARDPAELTDEDVEADQVEEMARLLLELEENGDDAPPALPACRKMQFDLCTLCFGKFASDPLGRESVAKFDFSEN